MINNAKTLNVKLRPMIKTHRSVEGAFLQLYGSDIVNVDYDTFLEEGAITVATIVEAEFYAAHGFQNILFPYAMTLDKLKRAKVIAQKN